MRALAVGLLCILALLQYRFWAAEGGLLEARRLAALVAEQQAEASRLRARNEALEAEVSDLKDGLEAVEERARAELGMIRRGETFYHVVEQRSR